MKYLGNMKVTLLKERQKYKELFSPLSASEYEDLRQSIRKGGILNDLIVERNGDGYVLLSGHHRKAVAQELGINGRIGNGDCGKKTGKLSRRTRERT